MNRSARHIQACIDAYQSLPKTHDIEDKVFKLDSDSESSDDLSLSQVIGLVRSDMLSSGKGYRHTQSLNRMLTCQCMRLLTTDTVQQFLEDAVGASGSTPRQRNLSRPSLDMSFSSETSIDNYDCAVCRTAQPPVQVDPREPFGRHVIACSKCKQWSHLDCIQQQLDVPDNVTDHDVDWRCPYCARVPLWDDSMYDHFLFDSDSG